MTHMTHMTHKQRRISARQRGHMAAWPQRASVTAAGRVHFTLWGVPRADDEGPTATNRLRTIFIF
jgi:hypothetical protein